MLVEAAVVGNTRIYPGLVVVHALRTKGSMPGVLNLQTVGRRTSVCFNRILGKLKRH